MTDSKLQGGVLRWEDPPDPVKTAPGVSDTVWPIVAAQLKQRPGRWALVAIGRAAVHAVPRINNGSTRHFQPPGSFEAVQRTWNGEIRIYARFIAEDHHQ